MRCGQHLLYLGVISMHFRVFSQGQGTEWGIFLGMLKFQILFGCLKFLIFYFLFFILFFFWGGGGGGGERLMLNPSLLMKKMRVSAPCGQMQVYWIIGANLH